MDAERKEQIRARAEAATPGTWTPNATGHSKTGRMGGDHYWEVRIPIRGTLHSMTLDNLMDREDAQFIAHARDDIPYLLIYLDAAEQRADENEQLAKRLNVDKELWQRWCKEAEQRATEAEELLAKAAEAAYQSEVVDTEMEDSWIGTDKEYADKADWIDSWIDGLKEA